MKCETVVDQMKRKMEEKWTGYLITPEMLNVKEADELSIHGVNDLNSRYNLFMDILKYRQEVAKSRVDRLRSALL